MAVRPVHAPAHEDQMSTAVTKTCCPEGDRLDDIVMAHVRHVEALCGGRCGCDYEMARNEWRDAYTAFIKHVDECGGDR